MWKPIAYSTDVFTVTQLPPEIDTLAPSDCVPSNNTIPAGDKVPVADWVGLETCELLVDCVDESDCVVVGAALILCDSV